jgi:hypothetical protein
MFFCCCSFFLPVVLLSSSTLPLLCSRCSAAPVALSPASHAPPDARRRMSRSPASLSRPPCAPQPQRSTARGQHQTTTRQRGRPGRGQNPASVRMDTDVVVWSFVVSVPSSVPARSRCRRRSDVDSHPVSTKRKQTRTRQRERRWPVERTVGITVWSRELDSAWLGRTAQLLSICPHLPSPLAVRPGSHRPDHACTLADHGEG